VSSRFPACNTTVISGKKNGNALAEMPLQQGIRVDVHDPDLKTGCVSHGLQFSQHLITEMTIRAAV